MKKLFISIFALLVSVSLFAERITLEDAATVANNFMNVAVTSVNGVKKAAPAKRMVRKAMNTTEEPQYYLYENENGEGWVIIAANDAVTPILAYSETGHFRTDNMPSNIRHWMGKYDQFIKRIETDGVEAAEETKAEWKALRKGVRKAQAAAVVGPLIQTQWDQDAPYNNLCPGTGRNKAYTGCVATAMAQVMNYWQWPKRGIGSHSYRPLDVNEPYAVDDEGYYILDEYNQYIPVYSSRYPYTLSADFENTTYDWDNMKNSYSDSATSAQKTAVATLMYHCGVATEMMYGNDEDGGSGTYTVNYGDEDDPTYAQNALWRHFGYKKPTSYMRDGYEEYDHTYYNSWTPSNWTAMLKAELDKQHPIMYDGAGSSPESGGHSFICDGYDSAGKFHFNCGWSGSNDGYYTLSNLIPRGGGAGGGGYDFSYEQSVIIGIEPDSSTYVDPVDPIDPVDPTPGTGAFTLLTNISNLAAGDEVILVSSTKSVAAGAENSSKTANWFDPEDVTITNNQITLDANSTVKIMTVGKSGSNWTFTNGGQLLVATAEKKVIFANSGASTWSISIDGGDATIQNTTESYGRFLYNVSNPRFTTYTSNTSKTMLLPQLYYRRPSTTGMTNISAGAEVRKIIENGQVVIVRGNEKYSVFGQKIQ